MKTKILSALTIILLLACLPITTAKAEVQYINKSVITFANINNPIGLTTAEDGTIYFSSSDSHKIYAHSGDTTSIFAGFDILDDNDEPMAGLFDSDTETTLFNSPAGMDMDDAGNIYVADAENHAIRMISKDGNVTTIAGDGIFGDKDGKGVEARFHLPMDIAVSEDGTIYVADTLNHVIRKITAGGLVMTLTKYSDRLVEVGATVVIGGDYQDGVIDEAMFNEPASLVIDEKGNLIVSDSGNHVIRYIDFEKNEVSTIAGSADASKYNDTTLYLDGGYADGNLANAKFHTPKGLALTEGGNLLAVDASNSHLRYINFDNQSVQTLTKAGELFYPSDIGVTVNGDLIVTDTRGNDVKKFILWELPAGFGNYESAKKRYDDEHLISPSARDAVYQVQRLGIMTGSLNEKYLFSPRSKLTRGQFAKMIVNHLNLKHVVDANVFPDVKNDEWYAPYIHTAAAYGILNGYEDGTFRPNAPITRQQITLMIGRANKWSTDEEHNKYKDQGSISKEAMPYVQALYENGVMTGYPDGTFRPENHIPRETAAVIMANLNKTK